jgi:hypothetical protein
MRVTLTEKNWRMRMITIRRRVDAETARHRARDRVADDERATVVYAATRNER